MSKDKLTVGDRVREMREDLKGVAKLAIDSDETELAEETLKTFHALCRFSNELSIRGVHEWDWSHVAPLIQRTPPE